MNTAIKTAILSLIMAFSFALPHLVIGQSVQYEYDNLNRLTEINYNDSLIIQYNYDELGNRVSSIVDNTPTNTSEEIGLSEINIFPNPASTVLSVDVTFSESVELLSLKVYDSTGRTIYDKQLEGTDSLLQHEINTVAFPVGTYIIELKTEKGAASSKFMIQR